MKTDTSWSCYVKARSFVFERAIVPIPGEAFVRDPAAPMRGHKFAGMQTRELNGVKQYRGTCSCGHAEVWTGNKDWAWQEIAEHWRPVIEYLQAHFREASR